MPITVNKLYLVNISAFGLSDILFSFSFPVRSISLPRNTLNSNHGFNYLYNLHFLVLLPLSEPKAQEQVSLPYTSTTFPELNNHLIW